MKPTDKPKEEVVEDGNLFTTRLAVPGGWIYRSYDKSHGIMGMCFVPEPKAFEGLKRDESYE